MLLQSKVLMADIQSFSALRYDPRQVSLAQVVTQPFDKITPAMQERYYAASPYNLVRVILGKRDATDTPSENVYSRASNFFSEWRRAGALLQDAEPSIYRYAEEFTTPAAAKMERDGFIALGKLQDY